MAQEILQTALHLFAEHGYEETSIALIAREAGVSERTVFRYFGTKEDLVGGDQHEFARILADAVDDHSADADVWAALRAGIAAVQALHSSREDALERFRLLHATAALRAGWLEKRLRIQEELLPLVTARLGPAGEATELTARAVIATVFACLDAASTTWVARDGQGEIMDLYDECVATVRGLSARADQSEESD
ncbi:TetR/AcrR family transcriptional regulator [Amycolatopsis sp. lyj-23]|uniref:TetR/AcrR family transcriptional regulator n=1 Tax=Amycolatopsis sp. lyj-23 TaxID=2789283 RepID=UPI00397CD948